MHAPRLTYARVTAAVALTIALAGGAAAAVRVPANSVGSRQLRHAAVTRAKLAPGSVGLHAVKPGSLGANVLAPGEIQRGRPGPAGAQGDPGPAQLAQLEYEQNSYVIPTGNVGWLTVTCKEPHSAVIGGGAQITNLSTTAVVLDSQPDGRGGWKGVAGNESGNDQTLTTFAICSSSNGTTP